MFLNTTRIFADPQHEGRYRMDRRCDRRVDPPPALLFLTVPFGSDLTPRNRWQRRTGTLRERDWRKEFEL